MKTYVIDTDCIIGSKGFTNFTDIFSLKLFPVNTAVVRKINKLYKMNRIILHSSRPISMRILTERWLETYHVKYHKLFMNKPYGDVYIDTRNMSKEEFLNEI